MSNNPALDIAVGRGIISQAQANSIRLIESEAGTSRHQVAQTPTESGHDEEENIKFAGGFGNVFIALGIGTLLYGILQTALVESAVGIVGISVFCWALAEVVCTWQKRTLPGIVTAIGFVLSIGSSTYFYLSGKHPATFFDRLDLLLLTQDKIIWLLPLCTFAASIVFYFRFRLPFSLFLAAISFALTLILGIFSIVDVVQFTTIVIPSLILSGLILFATALYFDISDRRRISSHADNAFWLHLVASPLIVHSIMWQVAIWITETNGFSAVAIKNSAPELSFVVLCIFVLLMVLALIIDRRAMLVSSLVYVTVAIGYLGSQTGGVASATSFVPIILGGGILSVGIGWQALRKILFRILPLSSLEPYLSPVK